ncbi:MAG: hypothetical protein IJC48_07565 [Clostridia bacterium]|nr:hypothetical protein [Clostridia bacterium]
MYCVRCGKRADEGRRFCIKCGMRLIEPDLLIELLRALDGERKPAHAKKPQKTGEEKNTKKTERTKTEEIRPGKSRDKDIRLERALKSNEYEFSFSSREVKPEKKAVRLPEKKISREPEKKAAAPKVKPVVKLPEKRESDVNAESRKVKRPQDGKVKTSDGKRTERAAFSGLKSESGIREIRVPAEKAEKRGNVKTEKKPVRSAQSAKSVKSGETARKSGEVVRKSVPSGKRKAPPKRKSAGERLLDEGKRVLKKTANFVAEGKETILKNLSERQPKPYKKNTKSGKAVSAKEAREREERRKKTVVPKREPVRSDYRKGHSRYEEETFVEKYLRSIIAMTLLGITVLFVVVWGVSSPGGKRAFAQLGVGGSAGYILLGDDCMAEENYTRAVEYYYKALSRRTSEEAAQKLALAYSHTGDIEREASALLLLIDKYPRNTDARERLWMLYPDPATRPAAVQAALSGETD